MHGVYFQSRSTSISRAQHQYIKDLASAMIGPDLLHQDRPLLQVGRRFVSRLFRVLASEPCVAKTASATTAPASRQRPANVLPQPKLEGSCTLPVEGKACAMDMADAAMTAAREPAHARSTPHMHDSECGHSSPHSHSPSRSRVSGGPYSLEARGGPSASALQEAVRAVQRGEGSDSDKSARIQALFARASEAVTAAAAEVGTGVFPGKGASRGCEHYQRSCWIKAKCCGKYYVCRRCHDEHENHEIDRHATELVACVACGDQDQPVASHCRTCNEEFAHYFCGVCKFYDDTPGKDAYHCDACGICRVGKGLGVDNHHCNGCNSCVPIAVKGSHPCRERSLDANCPICNHYLATSTEPVVFMRCGHTMHVDCLAQHTASRYTCPLCSKSLTDMQSWYRALDERLAKEVTPSEYANRVSRVLCHDCGEKSVARFHFTFHRCACCFGYNTRVLEQYDVPLHEIPERPQTAEEVALSTFRATNPSTINKRDERSNSDAMECT